MAITPFRVIHSRQFRYQSKARMPLPMDSSKLISFRTVSEIWRITGSILAVDEGVRVVNAFVPDALLNSRLRNYTSRN